MVYANNKVDIIASRSEFTDDVEPLTDVVLEFKMRESSIYCDIYKHTRTYSIWLCHPT